MDCALAMAAPAASCTAPQSPRAVASSAPLSFIRFAVIAWKRWSFTLPEAPSRAELAAPSCESASARICESVPCEVGGMYFIRRRASGTFCASASASILILRRVRALY